MTILIHIALCCSCMCTCSNYTDMIFVLRMICDNVLNSDGRYAIFTHRYPIIKAITSIAACARCFDVTSHHCMFSNITVLMLYAVYSMQILPRPIAQHVVQRSRSTNAGSGVVTDSSRMHVVRPVVVSHRCTRILLQPTAASLQLLMLQVVESLRR